MLYTMLYRVMSEISWEKKLFGKADWDISLVVTCMYLPKPSATSKMRYKVNFSALLSWSEFKVFILLDWLFNWSWRNYILIHIFPKVKRSLVQDLNSGHRLYFLQQ